MRKSNGFVFMETVVVVSVLSITLLVLFSSYSHILRKARERNAFDTTEMIYKTYFIKDAIITTHGNVTAYYNKCSVIYPGVAKKDESRVCEPSKNNDNMVRLAMAYDIEKIYFLNPYVILSHANSKEYLLSFDATTIDYINNMGKSVNQDLLVVKYKKYYDSSRTDFEIIHSSMEVQLEK